MCWDVACLLPSFNLCVCVLLSGFFNWAVNSARARLCCIFPGYIVHSIQLDQHS